MIPSLGRIVHNVLPEGHKNKGGHRAAIITAIYEGRDKAADESPLVDLTVFLQAKEDVGQSHDGAHGFMFLEAVPFDPTGRKPGSWHEPERIEEKKPIPAATERK